MKKCYAKLLVVLTAVLMTLAGAALAQESGVLRIENGQLQPILKYSDPTAMDYSNEDSDILRFCVYVETDYDTDSDGRPDLVKVFVQVPRPAAEGKYKAAAIYDPTPYLAGTCNQNENRETELFEETPFDYQKLFEKGEKRVPTAEVTTLEFARNAEPADWNYATPASSSGYYNIGEYDYFLLRGYAIIEACGIGTYGSEGFELCGMIPECDSHKAVVEWLAGDRVAYTDKTGTTAIKADWCNGSVAMTGASYGGTMSYEVATTGVKGLKTIVPVAGVASWYEYTNSQGIPIIYEVMYAHSLASYNCGGSYTDDTWTELKPGYGSWLWQIAHDQEATNGDFAPVWDMLEYGKNYANIQCSALIVQGLNDFNVTTKHADLMAQAFEKAGQTCKMLFHQDGHNSVEPRMINNELWYETLNKWYAHYLYGVDNGIENMPAVTVQSNVDGSFRTFEKWRDFDLQTFKANGIDMGDTAWIDSTSIATKAAFLREGFDAEPIPQPDYYISLTGEQAAKYVIDLPENTTIYGVPEIHVRLCADNPIADGQMITAVLVDTMEDPEKSFDAFVTDPANNSLVPFETDGTFSVDGGEYTMDIQKLVQQPARNVTFTYGWTDLRNPDCGYDTSEYTLQEEGLDPDEYYDYTFYLLPTVYTVAPGHKLTLVLTTWDPYRAFLDDDFKLDMTIKPEYSNYTYGMTVDNASIEVRLPVAK